MAGCGIKPGVVVGATDVDGFEPIDSLQNEKNLFATIFSALGIDPYAEYDLPTCRPSIGSKSTRPPFAKFWLNARKLIRREGRTSKNTHVFRHAVLGLDVVGRPEASLCRLHGRSRLSG